MATPLIIMALKDSTNSSRSSKMYSTYTNILKINPLDIHEV